MRAVILLSTASCLVLAVMPAAQPIRRQPEPFVRVGVSYPIGLSRDGERAAADLEVIHALGFNAIRVPIAWADGEPVRRQYRFDDTDRMLELAGRAGLQVVLDLDTETLPEWLLRRYPDGRVVPASRTDGPRPERACLDHPGVRADVESYLVAVVGHRPPAWQTFDIGAPDDSVCVCPYTERRFREWLRETFGSDARPAALAAADRAAFVAVERRDHLAIVAGAVRGGRISSSRASAPSVIRQLFDGPPGQDDWLMTAAVDHYGTLVPPELGRVPSLTPAELAFALDGIRSAARDKGWLMTDGAPEGRAADLRLMTWAAFARGARGVTYDEWRRSGSVATSVTAKGMGLVGPDDTIGDRARAAGGLARVIGRNPALFAPLRPRAAKIAIVYDPRPPAAGDRAAFLSMSNIYRSLFERNIQVDFIHLDEIATGIASRYNLVFVASLPTLPGPVADALKAYGAAGGTLISGSTTPTATELAGILARARVGPEVRIDGATGPVETRFLESADVLMLIGLNHSDVPQRVKMTFTPDTQEAIWQNMETGAAVNFVAGPDGPAYTYSFGARDALVLMIRKSVR